MDVNRLQWQPQRGMKAILVVALAAIAAIGLAPHWAAGQWPWSQALEVPGIERLQTLSETNLSLQNWEVSGSGVVPINGQDWGLSEYNRPVSDDQSDDQSHAVNRLALLLLPQSWHDRQPTVEWVDLRGAQNWQVADSTVLRFTTETGTVRARYFRARTDQQTFAVMQWYAWPGGGDFAPGRWFWVDQLSQWRSGQRNPWVAVCLLLPIRSLDDVSAYQEIAIDLGQAIQNALATAAFGSE